MSEKPARYWIAPNVIALPARSAHKLDGEPPPDYGATPSETDSADGSESTKEAEIEPDNGENR